MVMRGVLEMYTRFCTVQHTYKLFIKGVTYRMAKCADAGKLQRVKR